MDSYDSIIDALIARSLDAKYLQLHWFEYEKRNVIRFYVLCLCTKRMGFKIPMDVRVLLWNECKEDINRIDWRPTISIGWTRVEELLGNTEDPFEPAAAPAV